MGSADMSGAVLPCYHAHDRHDNVTTLLQLSRVMVATIVLRPNLIDLGLLLGCPPCQGSIGAGEVLCGDVMLLQEAA